MRSSSRVVEVRDDAAGRGAWVVTERELRDADDGLLYCVLRQTSLLLGDGGFDPAKEALKPATRAPSGPRRAPDCFHDHQTPLQAALLFRLCVGMNPLHADPAVAASAGYDRRILHGMATCGVACHGVLAALRMPPAALEKGIGFSNAIGRPKNGPEKAPGRARRGTKCASPGGFSAQSGRLQARGWRVGRSLTVHGAQDWTPLSGLTLMLAMACRHSAQRHRRLQGSRSPWRQVSDSASGSSSEVRPRLALEQPCPADACGPNLGGIGFALDAGCGNAWHLLIASALAIRRWALPAPWST